MREIEWKVSLDGGVVSILEVAHGFNSDNIEDQLIIIGMLEDMKQQKLKKLETFFDKTIKSKKSKMA